MNFDLYAKEIIESIGDRGVSLLNEIFLQTRKSIEGIDAERFRADHSDDFELLDKLTNKRLLTDKWSDNKLYRPTLYSLPFINHPRSLEILEQANISLAYLQSRYKKELSTSILISEIAYDLEIDYEDIVETFLYMYDGHGWSCGHSLPFPFGEDYPNGEGAQISTCESMFSYTSFEEIIYQFYEWYFINPKNESKNWTLQFKTEDFQPSLGFFSDTNEIPEWYQYLDDTKKALISEISKALDNNLSALPTVGLRTLIEIIMAEKIGTEGGFAKKLRKFKENDYITGNHAQLLERVLDAGNAAAHRAHFPNKEDIRTCVDVVEHLMQGIYILEPKVKKLKDNTPKRN